MCKCFRNVHVLEITFSKRLKNPLLKALKIKDRFKNHEALFLFCVLNLQIHAAFSKFAKKEEKRA